MLRAAVLAFLLFAAPDADPARKLLRVAWASQYEWKEDKVANATFDFEWSRYTRTRRNEEFTVDVEAEAREQMREAHVLRDTVPLRATPDAAQQVALMLTAALLGLAPSTTALVTGTPQILKTALTRPHTASPWV